MKTYDQHWLVGSIARNMRRIANYGLWDGRGQTDYLERCKGFHTPTGAVLIFSRDIGHHTSGWWKNPDYERCFHLSLSFRDPVSMEPRPRDKKLTKEWVEAFYGSARDKIWSEPPYSPTGKRFDTWHYRLFCDPAWEPIIPRGEVYSRELTEAGWLSWSDVQAQLRDAEELAKEMAAE